LLGPTNLRAKYTRDEDYGLAVETPFKSCFLSNLPSVKISSTEWK
jgi:hypothetical protein